MAESNNPKEERSSDDSGFEKVLFDFRLRLKDDPSYTATEFLLEHPGLSEEEIIDIAYAEYLFRESKGEGVDIKYFSAQFGEHGVALLEQIRFHQAIGSNAELSEDEFVPELSQESTASDTAPNIPGLRVIRPLGRGGMGGVWLAFHEKLQRLVAVKLILREALSSEIARARFEAEARAAATIRHPNVVQIDELGFSNGEPYLVMEFIPGGTLAAFLEHATPSPREIASLLIPIAKALAFVHKAGILHRDLKPNNILLQPKNGLSQNMTNDSSIEFSERSLLEDYSPKIADFGLAKLIAVDQEASSFQVTRDGDILGTPSYMAPEQVINEAVGPWTDIYALGAILYQMASGKPPFTAASPWETWNLVVEAEPAALDKAIPKDLRAICHKCLEKTPASRYANMDKLAADLERFLRGEPVEARPISHLQRAIRLAKKYPAISTLAALSIISLLLALSVSLWSRNQLAALLVETEKARVGEKNARQQAQTNLLESLLNGAQAEIESNIVGRKERALGKLKQAENLLHDLSPADPSQKQIATLRGAANDLVDFSPVVEWRHLDLGPDQVFQFNRDFSRIAYINANGEVLVQDDFGKRLVYRISAGGVTGLLLSEDGRKLLLLESQPRIVELEKEGAPKEIPIPADSREMRFNRTADRLLGISPEGLWRFDLKTNRVDFYNVRGPISSYEVSPDGNRIAICGQDQVWIFDIAGKEKLAQFSLLENGTVGGEIAWHPNGTNLLAASKNSNTAILWDTAIGISVRRFIVPATPRRFHFTPSGRHLIVHSVWSDYATVIDTESTKERLRFFRSMSQSVGSNDKNQVLLCAYGEGKRPSIWRLDEEAESSSISTLKIPQTRRFEAISSSDASWIAVTNERGVEIYSEPENQLVGELMLGENAFGLLRFDSENRLWFGRHDGLVRVSFDRLGVQECHHIRSEEGFWVIAIDLTAKQKVMSNGSLVKLQAIESSEGGFELGTLSDARQAIFDQNGKWIAAASWNSREGIRVWSLPERKLIKTIPAASQVRMYLSPNGEYLLTASEDSELWRTSDWKLLQTIENRDRDAFQDAYAFEADSRAFYATSSDGKIVKFNIGDKEATTSWKLTDLPLIRSLAVTASDQLIAVGGDDPSTLRTFAIKGERKPRQNTDERARNAVEAPDSYHALAREWPIEQIRRAISENRYSDAIEIVTYARTHLPADAEVAWHDILVRLSQPDELQGRVTARVAQTPIQDVEVQRLHSSAEHLFDSNLDTAREELKELPPEMSGAKLVMKNWLEAMIAVRADKFDEAKSSFVAGETCFLELKMKDGLTELEHQLFSRIQRRLEVELTPEFVK